MKAAHTARGGDEGAPRPPPDGVSFELVPIERLRAHEEITLEVVDEVVRDLRREGGLREPILVARQEYVVLNGHHRLAALQRLHARKVPAWVVDYLKGPVELERWPDSTYTGEVTKAEVIAHGRAGRLFPPKTTRHHVKVQLPPKMVLLSELL